MCATRNSAANDLTPGASDARWRGYKTAPDFRSHSEFFHRVRFVACGVVVQIVLLVLVHRLSPSSKKCFAVWLRFLVSDARFALTCIGGSRRRKLSSRRKKSACAFWRRRPM